MQVVTGYKWACMDLLFPSRGVHNDVYCFTHDGFPMWIVHAHHFIFVHVQAVSTGPLFLRVGPGYVAYMHSVYRTETQVSIKKSPWYTKELILQRLQFKFILNELAIVVNVDIYWICICGFSGFRQQYFKEGNSGHYYVCANVWSIVLASTFTD